MKFKNIIQGILKEEVSRILTEDFKSQRNNFISQINSPNAETIVDRYLNDFKEIKDNKYAVAANADLEGLNVKKGNDRFDIDKYKTFKELETLVDYVSGQVKVGSANFEDIKVDGKPIYEDKEVEIYYADTPRACIQYKGKFPYSWCVSRKDATNMFYNYRLEKHEPAFYFVKRKKAMDKEFKLWNIAGTIFSGEWKDKYHFFVIQVVKNAEIANQTKNQYYVTSAANDGDKPMNWNNILEIAPELNGLQYIFTPKPLTEKEREKIEKYKNGLSDEEFAKLPYIEKEYYMAVYVKMDKHLTDNQFKNLPEDLKNKYVGLGVGLSDGQFDMIKDTKLLKRYANVTIKKFEEFFKSEKPNKFVFQPFEFNFLEYDILKKGELKFTNIKPLLMYSPNKDDLINKIIKIKGDEIDSDIILYLIEYTSNPYETVNKIIKSKGDKLTSNDIEIFLDYDYNFSKLIDINKFNQFLNEIDEELFVTYLNSSPDIYSTALFIINNKQDNTINKEIINYLLEILSYHTLDDDKVINIFKLINNKFKYINMDEYSLFNFLINADNPYAIANSIGLNFVNHSILNFDKYRIGALILSSKNPDEIKKLLIQAGVDISLIPESKKTIKKVLREYIK